MNFKQVNILKDGLNTDLENRAEGVQTYKYGLNGRLTSKRGVLSFSSIKGSVEVYNNSQIIKYLGWHSFDDELILFVKYDDTWTPDIDYSFEDKYHEVDQSKDYQYADINDLNILPAGFDLEAGLTTEIINTTKIKQDGPTKNIDDSNIECSEVNNKFFTKNYTLSDKTIPFFKECTFELEDIVLENNKQYLDAIISITEVNGVYTDTLLWKGYLNWDINRKIIAVGLDENIHIKKVYFTDYLNPFRMFNRHDTMLSYKLPETFDVRQDVKLPQPRVSDVRSGGLIKSMSVMYVYRLITKDGVVTDFSPTSNITRIYPDKKSGSKIIRGNASVENALTGGGTGLNDPSNPVGGMGSLEDISMGGGVAIPVIEEDTVGYINGTTTNNSSDTNNLVGVPDSPGRPVTGGAGASGNSGGDSGFRGGDISEVTNKMVLINLNIPNYESYDKVECIALEYEINGSPTSIRTLGIKDALEHTVFYHTGNENSISNITLLEIISNGEIWKYNKSMSIIRNKLVVGGLRLDPYPIQVRILEDMFLLKGWDDQGNTHDCLINPKPYDYKYIDPANTDKYKVSSKVEYSQIQAFDTFTLKLTNRTDSAFIEKQFINNTDEYVDFLQDVKAWLLSTDLSSFPNLTIDNDPLRDNVLLFTRTVSSTLTDLDDYQFSANTKQLIIQKDSEYEINTDTATTANLVHGAVSYDFNVGNGVRVSWYKENHKLLSKAVENTNSGKLLPLETPTLKKGFMKGEIYRLGLQCYKNGTQLFVIPLGDIQVPALGDNISYIDKQGKGVITTDKYRNQYVEDNVLFNEQIMMKLEVRFSCEMKTFIDSYQIVYVERTEDNRTILAQGITAPLQRINGFSHPSISAEDYTPETMRKWTLPYMGGPLHELNGFKAFDSLGENGYNDFMPDIDTNATYEQDKSNVENRIITSRNLMYFDSPDIIYDKVSTHSFDNATVEVLGRLKTDHNRNALSNLTNADTDSKELVFSKYTSVKNEIEYLKFNDEFTKKYGDFFNDVRGNSSWDTAGNILTGGILGVGRAIGNWITGNSGASSGDTYGRESSSYGDEGYAFVRTSVFSQFTPSSLIYGDLSDATHQIDEHKTAGEGLIIPGELFNLKNPISNNAITFGYWPAYYSSFWRKGQYQGNLKDHDPHYSSELLKTSNKSSGYRTLIIKTDDNLFTDEFIGNEVIKMRAGIYKGDEFGLKPVTDAHALINIKVDTKDTVYGGRSKYAFSKNVFIPLSETIDLYTESNTAQVIKSEGDTYTSLFFRTKNDYNDAHDLKNIGFYNQKLKEGVIAFEDISSNTPTAWNYAAVIESTTEERLSFDYRHYREDQPSNYDVKLIEFINPCYDVINNLKAMIPLPFLFKDNPLMSETLSVSKVKVNGDYYDSFVKFLANDMYELEKKHGEISNVVNYLDDLYVLQKRVTSLVKVDQRDTIRTEENAAVQLVTGTGTPITDHKIISYFGTGIPRGYSVSEAGLIFFDENKLELVNINKGLSTSKNLHHAIYDKFNTDKVIDTELYYDERFFESNVAFKTLSGERGVLSFNEYLKVFNGWYEYSNDIFIPFKNKIYAPVYNNPVSLHKLNEGNYLNLFGEQKVMKLGIVVTSRKSLVNIYKALSIQLNTNYKIKEIRLTPSIDENITRIIDETHFRYFIREGIHTMPLRNITDRHSLRSEWMYIELEIESIDNKKVDLFSITTHLRTSTL